MLFWNGWEMLACVSIFEHFGTPSKSHEPLINTWKGLRRDCMTFEIVCCVHVNLKWVGKRSHVWVNFCASCAKHFHSFPNTFQNIRNHSQTCGNSLKWHDMTFECVCNVSMVFLKELGNVCTCDWVYVHCVRIIFNIFEQFQSLMNISHTVGNSLGRYNITLTVFPRSSYGLKCVGKRSHVRQCICASCTKHFRIFPNTFQNLINS